MMIGYTLFPVAFQQDILTGRYYVLQCKILPLSKKCAVVALRGLCT